MRGINVSGQKKIKMAELREHLSELPLSDITTYIQSGNIIFSSEIEDQQQLQELIFQKIKEKYGFEVPTTVITRDYLIKAEAENPYPKEAKNAGNQVFIAFLSNIPDSDRQASFRELSFAPDRIELKDKNLYFHCPNGAANSKISNNMFESKLKVSSTSRNFKTVWKLIELSA